MPETPTLVSELRRFQAPYDWEAVDASVLEVGGVVLDRLFKESEVAALNREIDDYLTTHEHAGRPESGSAVYDKFLGYRTVRLQGLIAKFESAADWIGRRDLVDWGSRLLGPVSTSILLNAAELIQIGPGEPAQYLHRDSDSWPMAPLGDNPLIVNALIALDSFTPENGATWVAPGSWRWDRHRRAEAPEMTRAIMEPGDALLFRGDIVHGGGSNRTTRPRRALSITYCAGWLRPVENSILNIPRAQVKTLPARVQDLLGYAAYDGTRDNGGLVGLYENGDPRVFLRD